MPAIEFSETPDIHSSSAEYAGRFSGAVGEWFLARQLQSVLQILEGREVRRIIDVGGGHAQIAPALADRGVDLTVTGSSAACEARIASLSSTGRCTFKIADILSLPFADKEFDAAISLRILSHCNNWPRLISELCRVSKKVVIVDYPVLKSFNFLTPLLFQVKKGIEGNTRTYTIFSDKEIRDEFNKCGFQPSNRIAQFFLPMGMHRFLKNVKISSAIEGAAQSIGLCNAFGSPVIAGFEIK